MMKEPQARQTVAANAFSLVEGIFNQALDAQGMGTYGAWIEPDDDLAEAMITLGPIDLAQAASAAMSAYMQSSAGHELMQLYLQAYYDDVQQSFMSFTQREAKVPRRRARRR